MKSGRGGNASSFQFRESAEDIGMVMRKVFLLAAMLCAALVLCACASPHESIREEDVEEAWVYDSMDAAATYQTLSQSEISELVAWFNGCTDIRLNRDFAGTVTINGINIKMKDDIGISILKSGKNFEVQVGGPDRETVSYWAKQPDIEALLDSLEPEQ